MKDRIIKKLEDQIKTLTKTIEKGKILLCDLFCLIAVNAQCLSEEKYIF